MTQRASTNCSRRALPILLGIARLTVLMNARLASQATQTMSAKLANPIGGAA